MNTILLRVPEVTRRTGLSRTRLYGQVAAGDFPAPIKIGPRSVAWASDEVDAWIGKKLAQRGR